MNVRGATGPNPDVEIYPVGVLAALLALGGAYSRRLATAPADVRRDIRAHARGKVRNQLRYLYERARMGQWREVKNSFNGYLAEPYRFPAEMTRCGSGWTRRRAMRSLRRHGWSA